MTTLCRLSPNTLVELYAAYGETVLRLAALEKRRAELQEKLAAAKREQAAL